MITFAITSRKGGAGKTTTAVNLAAALARRHRVVLVDLDPQAQASVHLGLVPESLPFSVYDVLLGEVTAEDASLATSVPNLRVIPADAALQAAEVDLARLEAGEARLRLALLGLEGVDYVIIDTPSVDGWLSLNALVAADQAIVAMPAQFMAIDGLCQQIQNIDRVRSEFNPRLQVAGVVPTRVEMRSAVTTSVLQVVKNNYGNGALLPNMYYDPNLMDAPCFHVPVSVYAPSSCGTRDHQCLADVLARRFPVAAPVPASPAPVAQWVVNAA